MDTSTKGMISVLMPLSCYKKNDLYRHVETFELANPKLFKDAVITENLSICLLRKENINKYSWLDLTLTSIDQKYIEYYKWNIEHSKGYIPKQIRDEQLLPENLDKHRDEWFIESIRCSTVAGGSGFGLNGNGYKWNNNIDNLTIAFVFMIDLHNKAAKDAFIKWWYNGKKFESFSSKVILGTKNSNFVGSSYFAIPQIEWDKISDKYPDYEKDPDFYVLKEMGLKWDEKKEKIIKA